MVRELTVINIENTYQEFMRWDPLGAGRSMLVNLKTDKKQRLTADDVREAMSVIEKDRDRTDNMKIIPLSKVKVRCTVF